MKLIRSGIGVTTIQLTNATGPNTLYDAVGHDLGPSSLASNFEISDLTIDCNLPASFTAACGAVRLMGQHARIEPKKSPPRRPVGNQEAWTPR